MEAVGRILQPTRYACLVAACQLAFQLVVPVSHKLLHSVAARGLSSSNGCAAVPFKLVRLAW